jgi:uncharacterized protein (TIGR02453 family)
MTERFDGFGADVREWFEGLERDNSRAYFTATRTFYDERVRGQMQALLDELAQRLGGEPRIFRQHRDLRFSRDRSPYKTNTYGVITGTPLAGPGLYVSISAHALVAGSGYHVMARDLLDRYREALAGEAHGPALAAATAAARHAGLELWGDSLATAPRGYPREHPRIELLRRTSLSLGAARELGAGIGRAPALRFCERTWRAAAPVTGWLDAHVGPSRSERRR